MNKNKVETQHIVVMYTEKHLTGQQIGDMIGMSRAGVMKRLRKAGIKADQGEHVTCICDYCGSECSTTRARWRRTARQYCGEQCYYKSRENPAYLPWRQGQNIARQIVNHYFKLQSHHVVHHIDGDNTNNKLSNLMVFESQSDHMTYHHGIHTVTPIWMMQ